MKPDNASLEIGAHEGRLADLERSNRSLRLWVQGQVVFVLCLVVWIAYLEFIPRPVTATEFELVDAHGQRRAILGMMEGNALNPDRHPALSIVQTGIDDSLYPLPSTMYLTAGGLYVTPGPFDRYEYDVTELRGTPGVMAISPLGGFQLSPIGGSGTLSIPVQSDGRFLLILVGKDGSRIQLEPGKAETWEAVVGDDAKR